MFYMPSYGSSFVPIRIICLEVSDWAKELFLDPQRLTVSGDGHRVGNPGLWYVIPLGYSEGWGGWLGCDGVVLCPVGIGHVGRVGRIESGQGFSHLGDAARVLEGTFDGGVLGPVHLVLRVFMARDLTRRARRGKRGSRPGTAACVSLIASFPNRSLRNCRP